MILHKRIMALLLIMTMLLSVPTMVKTASASSNSVNELILRQKVSDSINGVSSNFFPYTNSDIYVADSLINGLINKEGIAAGSDASLYRIGIFHDYTYETLAKNLMDDSVLVFNSSYWKNIQNTLNSTWHNITNWQEEMYILLLMDYLNYYTESEEFIDSLTKNTAKHLSNVLTSVTENLSDDYLTSIDEILKSQSLSDAITFSDKYGWTYTLNEYVTLLGDIKDISHTARDYYQNLSKALAIKDADVSRIMFLKEMKNVAATMDNEYFISAVDKIIKIHESSRGKIMFDESLNTMVDVGHTLLFDELINICPESEAIIEGLKTYASGLNWLFNSDDISEGNLKLLTLYVIGMYAKQAVFSLSETYTNSPTDKNATFFVNAYLCYLYYQRYATDNALGFISTVLYDGVYNEIKNIFSNENDITYNEFQGYLNYDINLCKEIEHQTGGMYNLFLTFIGYSIDYGICGDNLSWTLDANGTLTISGTGVMKNYEDTTEDYELTSSAPWYQYRKQIKKIVLDEGITNIGSSAFYRCINATDVDLPDSLTIIGDRAFEDCINLREVALPDSLTAIGSHAFQNCSKLIKIDFFKLVTTIGSFAFEGCIGLTKITLPNSLTSIGGAAFSGCTGLTEVTLPDFLQTIGAYAFRNCTSLTEIIIPDTVTSIAHCAFEGCTSLMEIDLVNTSLVTIDMRAFMGCINLTKISLPEQLVNINSEAFRNCISLKKISFPESLEIIKEYAFSECDSLATLTFPEGVKLYYYAFNGCSNLTTVTLPKSWCVGRSTSSHSFCTPFTNCENLQEIEISMGTEEIPEYAFCSCNYLKKITFPSTLTTIGSHAFHGCDGLTEINLLNSLKKINYCSFADCSNLTKIIIPASVTFIDDKAFLRADSLTIHGYTNSYAETYAKNQLISFASIDTANDCGIQGHSYIMEICTKEHLKDEATCTTSATYFRSCVCGMNGTETFTIGEPMGHSFILYDGNNNATCVNDATETAKCDRCEVIDTKIIPDSKLQHRETVDKSVEPTCVKNGLTEGKHCSACNATLVEQKMIAALGHKEIIDKAVPPTLFETGLTEGKHCELCGEIFVIQEIIPSLQESLVYGDANEDGYINTLDALAILKHVARIEYLSEKNRLTADVNADTYISSLDALDVLKYSAGILTEFGH